jgi:hypothetical protein
MCAGRIAGFFTCDETVILTGQHRSRRWLVLPAGDQRHHPPTDAARRPA